MGDCLPTLCHNGRFCCGGIRFDANIPGCCKMASLGMQWDGTDVLQVVGFLAAGLTYSTAIVNTLVYSSDGAKEASAAGFILLSMVMVLLPRPRWCSDILTLPRSSGSSTSAPRHKPPIVDTSTPSPSTKNNAPQPAIVAPCPPTINPTAQKPRYLEITKPLRCIPQRSLMASRPLRPCLATQAE